MKILVDEMDDGMDERLIQLGYDAYPKTTFEKISQKSEIVIMIHGLRNNKSGALAKYVIAEKRLKTLNYKYDVVGYSLSLIHI